MKTIVEMLKNSKQNYGQKIAFSDESRSVTYDEFYNNVMSIGTHISKLNMFNKPVAIITERSVKCLECMFGILASGNFYTVIDCDMPGDRIESIFSTLTPAAVIVSENCIEKANAINYNGDIIKYSDCVDNKIDVDMLSSISSKIIDTNPAYVLFTSGSTGVPKGAVISHKSVISYTKWYSDTFDISDETVFGSQTPFYFSMSVSDVFSTVYKGATLNIIPKKLFSFPMNLLEFLNNRKVNTIYWVPSALCIIANWKVFDYAKPEYLNKVLFAGEVMPVRQLNYWIEKLPYAMFANLFGPTETTDICTYYIVNRKFEDGETLPIGTHCDNCDVFIVNSDGVEAKQGENGELYARGSFLAMGYYNNPEKTSAAFVQNPLNRFYPEIVYKTGDIVEYNDKDELIYVSRKDFQIKHMGYRIELGEIEAAASTVDEITTCAAVYDDKCDKIIFVFQGKKIDLSVLSDKLSKRLPPYMMPNKYIRVKTIPYNQNGKIDRKWIKNNYNNL